VRVRSMRGGDMSVPFAASSSFGELRALVAQRLGGASTSILVHHGEVVKDQELVSTRMKGEEEVIFFMEIHQPTSEDNSARGTVDLLSSSSLTEFSNNLMQRIQQAQQAQSRASQPLVQPQQQAQAHRTSRQSPQSQDERHNAELITQLVDMGFPRARAEKALRVTGFDLMDAVNWLAEHQEDAAGAAPPAPTTPPVVPPKVKALESVFEPVFQAIALAAHGNDEVRRSLERVRLPAMEDDGWRGFSACVQRIWKGERDAGSLCVSLDPNTAHFVRKVIEFVEMPEKDLLTQIDDDSRHALPRDPQFETILNQLKPNLTRLAVFATKATKVAFGEAEMTDAEEEGQLVTFVENMEKANYQLKTIWDMLCAGVRSSQDLFDCIVPLSNGKPDDRSFRIVRFMLKEISILEK